MEKLIANASAALPGRLHIADSPEYEAYVQSYWSAQENALRPGCVIQPQSVEEVATAVKLLVAANREAGEGGHVPFAIRSGGHCPFAGAANVHGGVTLDLRALNHIRVTGRGETVAIGTGASWGEVYRTLDAQGLAVPGGRHSQVGVGGLTLGGGLSHFSARVGLVCDNVVAYELVLPSGEIASVRNKGEHTDLFRALQGGGNNFGIVTEVVLRTIPASRLWGGTLMHSLDTKDQQLETLFAFAGNPSYDEAASLIQSVGMRNHQGTVQKGFVNGIVYTKPEALPDVIKPFTTLEPVFMNTLRELSLIELTKEQDSFNVNGLHQVMIATTVYNDLGLLHKAYDLWDASCEELGKVEGMVWSLTFQPIVPAMIDKSPFLQSVTKGGQAIMIVQITGTWDQGRDAAQVETAATRLIVDVDAAAKAAAKSPNYTYLNYAHAGQKVFSDGSDGGEDRLKFLQGVSRRYDPNGVFQTCVPGGFKLF